MKICPICRKETLATDDVNDAAWVALGEPVCSSTCHQEAYEFVKGRQGHLFESTATDPPFYSMP